MDHHDNQWFNDKPVIDPLQLREGQGIASFVDGIYARSGFNGRRFGEAATLCARMLDDDAAVCLTLAGAMTPIGMSGPIISLIEYGFIDFIISTGANLYHDMHRPYGQPVCQGHWDVDDNDLADRGVARIYDVFIQDEDTLMATDEVILDTVRRMDSGSGSTARLHYELGRRIADTSPHPERSLLVAAAKHDVPVYTSSPGDSSIGMNLLVPWLFPEAGKFRVDPIADVAETAAIVRESEKNGAIIVGGGSPKNFYLQTQPTLHQILRDGRGGHDYMIQLTTDSPHWGGLSGATPQEARSWGKIRDAGQDNVVVYSCASLTFPLLAQYLMERNIPRQHRRLYPKLDGMVDRMKKAAESNKDFRNDNPALFPDI